MKRHLVFILLAVQTIFVPRFSWAACDLSQLTPDVILEIAKLPRAEAVKKLQSLCDEIRGELEHLKVQADLAHIDQMTQLPNRHGILNRLEQRKASKDNLTFVAMLDIDHFKRVNDQMGHEIGDEVLKRVAEQVKKMITKGLRSQDFAGRWGGEEFIAIFDAPNVESAVHLMNRLRAKVREHTFSAIDLQGQPQTFRKTVSIGLSYFVDPEELDAVRDRADRALYEAKQTRDKTVFHPPPQKPPQAPCEDLLN